MPSNPQKLVLRVWKLLGEPSALKNSNPERGKNTQRWLDSAVRILKTRDFDLTVAAAEWAFRDDPKLYWREWVHDMEGFERKIDTILSQAEGIIKLKQARAQVSSGPGTRFRFDFDGTERDEETWKRLNAETCPVCQNAREIDLPHHPSCDEDCPRQHRGPCLTCKEKRYKEIWREVAAE